MLRYHQEIAWSLIMRDAQYQTTPYDAVKGLKHHLSTSPSHARQSKQYRFAQAIMQAFELLLARRRSRRVDAGFQRVSRLLGVLGVDSLQIGSLNATWCWLGAREFPS